MHGLDKRHDLSAALDAAFVFLVVHAPKPRARREYACSRLRYEHAFDRVPAVERLQPHDVERLRRSVAMLQPGAPALKRETALEVLAELVRVQDGLGRMIAECQRLLSGPARPAP